MKRLIFGLIILCLIISISLLGIAYTGRLIEDLNSSVLLAAKKLEAGEFNSAKTICESAKLSFEGKEKLLSLFLNHALIEEIEETLSLLPNLATNESKDSFLSFSEKLKTNLLELKESQKHIF